MNIRLATLTLSVAIAVSTPASSADQRIAGTFDGLIWSNGEKPGATRFEISQQGGIVGAYSFGAGETGTLTDCRWDAPDLRCIWNDEYGMGDFIVTFADDFSGFSGAWYETVNTTGRFVTDSGLAWTGQRRQ
ncbi:MAG: hypothetical protein ABJH45_01115 [Paracoccaceae bacterium]